MGFPILVRCHLYIESWPCICRSFEGTLQRICSSSLYRIFSSVRYTYFHTEDFISTKNPLFPQAIFFFFVKNISFSTKYLLFSHTYLLAKINLVYRYINRLQIKQIISNTRCINIPYATINEIIHVLVYSKLKSIFVKCTPWWHSSWTEPLAEIRFMFSPWNHAYKRVGD